MPLSMNVLYALRRSGDLVFQGDIIRHLCARGCRVTCLLFRSMEPRVPHPELEHLKKDCPSLTVEWAIDTPRPVVDDAITAV